MKKIIFAITIVIIGSINLNMEAANVEPARNAFIIIEYTDGNIDNSIPITQNRWFSSMNAIDIYKENYTIAIGYKGFSVEVARAQVDFLGVLHKCEFHLFDTCDTGQQRFVPK
jgi:hypothetical protein